MLPGPWAAGQAPAILHVVTEPPRDSLPEAGYQGLAAPAGPTMAVSILIVPGFALPLHFGEVFIKPPWKSPGLPWSWTSGPSPVQ